MFAESPDAQEIAGQLAAALVGLIGDFGMAEDLVQDAVVKALQRWPVDGIPDRPDAGSSKTKATFALSSGEPGATFECQLDRKPFKPCASPRRFKARPGKHRFKVQATDAAGNVDPTPATDKFKRID